MKREGSKGTCRGQRTVAQRRRRLGESNCIFYCEDMVPEMGFRLIRHHGTLHRGNNSVDSEARLETGEAEVRVDCPGELTETPRCRLGGYTTGCEECRPGSYNNGCEER